MKTQYKFYIVSGVILLISFVLWRLKFYAISIGGIAWGLSLLSLWLLDREFQGTHLTNRNMGFWTMLIVLLPGFFAYWSYTFNDFELTAALVGISLACISNSIWMIFGENIKY